MNGTSTFAKFKNFITNPTQLLYASMAWRSSGTSNSELVHNLYRNGVLSSVRVRDAMLEVDRAQYCSSPIGAYEDSPQPIGFRATISAPHMHAMALESLFPSKPSRTSHYPAARPLRVLDVGSGSGYLTHVMAELAGPGAQVVGVENIKPLADLGRENMRKSSRGRELLESGVVRFVVADGREGWDDPEGPEGDSEEAWDEKGWDAIHVGAGAADLHPQLVKQLRRPGRMFIPVDDNRAGFGQHIWQVDKDENGEVTKKQLAAVAYVPLTDAYM